MKRMVVVSLFTLLLMSITGFATDFNIKNTSSGPVRYAFVRSNRAGIDPVQTIQSSKSRIGTTGIGQLLGIWWECFNRIRGTMRYFFADVSELKIPVVRLGVPMEIGNDGLLSINGRRVTNVEEVQKPAFFPYQ